jgi:large subunit ribosomal protein L18e
MTKSKTLIDKQLKRKGNSILVETIIAAKKHDSWKEVAELLSVPRRKRINLNLNELNGLEVEEKDILVIPGKILSEGNIEKKLKIVALSFSERAKEKLLKSGCKVSIILEEIKSNPTGKEIKILRKEIGYKKK